MDFGEVCGVLEHEGCEGDDVEAGEGYLEALVVLDEAPAPRGPGEGAFNDPSPGQEHEASLGFGQFDDRERDAVFGGCGSRLVPAIALVDEGDLDALADDFLDVFGQLADLRAVIGGRGRDKQRQQMAERVDGQMHFGPLFPLGSVVAGPMPALGRRAQRAAVEHRRRRLRGPRPEARRSSARRSCASASNEPASSQRRVCW